MIYCKNVYLIACVGTYQWCATIPMPKNCSFCEDARRARIASSESPPAFSTSVAGTISNALAKAFIASFARSERCSAAVPARLLPRRPCRQAAAAPGRARRRARRARWRHWRRRRARGRVRNAASGGPPLRLPRLPAVRARLRWADRLRGAALPLLPSGGRFAEQATCNQQGLRQGGKLKLWPCLRGTWACRSCAATISTWRARCRRACS